MQRLYGEGSSETGGSKIYSPLASIITLGAEAHTTTSGVVLWAMLAIGIIMEVAGGLFFSSMVNRWPRFFRHCQTEVNGPFGALLCGCGAGFIVVAVCVLIARPG